MQVLVSELRYRCNISEMQVRHSCWSFRGILLIYHRDISFNFTDKNPSQTSQFKYHGAGRYTLKVGLNFRVQYNACDIT